MTENSTPNGLTEQQRSWLDQVSTALCEIMIATRGEGPLAEDKKQIIHKVASLLRTVPSLTAYGYNVDFDLEIAEALSLSARLNSFREVRQVRPWHRFFLWLVGKGRVV